LPRVRRQAGWTQSQKGRGRGEVPCSRRKGSRRGSERRYLLRRESSCCGLHRQRGGSPQSRGTLGPSDGSPTHLLDGAEIASVVHSTVLSETTNNCANEPIFGVRPPPLALSL